MGFLKIVMLKQNVLAALKISLFVGTVLNLINQGPGVYEGGTVSWFHLFMNYFVPFCVSSYSAAKNQLSSK
ncbi:nitrate/nitrite transporter NrtS [Marinomonas sp. 15G1-11]|uniref:Nitrate/nitrite transporter NrtS n=1 Tax=Marinomonas phaeophyticola TaxID=3004091 RepID=A0ABT4JSH8_9GAMM|nr:nitrate/nitrite transporter NrtS [Marinomonas sp. 15G1-11]MCZ2721231.1 nitrate/nitrite transporter NrtS [Marinomonas sp. 15G1-11]